jgi:hypothetical protein
LFRAFALRRAGLVKARTGCNIHTSRLY